MLATANQEKIFNRLLSKSSNLLCSDCGAKSPTWASIDFGVFVCLNCSGAHRALGPSVTRVRSTKLDTWQSVWLDLMQIGNNQCNEYWESKIGLSRKPTPSSGLDEIKRFVFDKYVKRKFAKEGQSDPVAKLKMSNSEEKSHSNQPKSAGMPPSKTQNKAKKNDEFIFQDFDSIKSDQGSSNNAQKKNDQFDIFSFDDAPATTNLTTTHSQQQKHVNHSLQKTHTLDFNTISFGTHTPNNTHHNQHFLNFNSISQHHELPKSSHSLNGSFSHPINITHTHTQFSNAFTVPQHIPSQIQYNPTNKTNSISPSFNVFGTKPAQQQPTVNINMYVNTINFNFGQKPAEDKKDPFHALNEFGF